MTHVFAFDHQHELAPSEVRALIGGKAANISTMVVDLGLPVPPGFTISTEACNTFLESGWPDGLEDELREHMAGVEEAVGRRFGDAGNPLLVSVRSGAQVSMPGMMDTILNLGLNDETVQGLAATSGEPGFAADCRRRFDEMYRAIVGVPAVPSDPWEQLRGAIEAVFRSWNSDRARRYREHERIPDHLGTAVSVQAMVFGNLSADSGTGVLFTRNPATGEATLYGDVMFDAQGEDVVAGDHSTQPVSVLEQRLPHVASELREYAERLERHYADLCDIEFTIERGRLWMLQVRIGKRSPQAALRIAKEMAEDPEFPLSRIEAVERVARLLARPPQAQDLPPEDAEVLSSGLGASPGIACGEIVTSADAAVAASDEGRRVILVRTETSPDDVHGMARSAGILTASGGLASHAAVVARGWGIPAIVGARELGVDAEAVRIGGRRFAVGDPITIDGSTGRIYAGEIVGERQTVPEAAVLLSWAEELGIEIPAPEDAPTTTMEGSETTSREEILRALLIKGYATTDALAASMSCTAEHAGEVVDRLVADGLAEISAGSFRLTGDGKATASELIAADREVWGVDNASAALDAFLELDARMKETVTAWQMREVGGEQTYNDHGDAAYDAAVLEKLVALHVDAADWLAPLTGRLTRLDRYRRRLQRAVECVTGGDNAYVASPRVDSFHSVWFELHEDLIHLSGRTRAEEVAAGRA